MSKTNKSALVISYGPVPTPSFQKIEGGGMRAWGLATGLKANGYDVTVAINEGFAQKEDQHEGISLVNWSLNDAFKSVINSFDVVVISYCMGDPSVFVVDNIDDEVTLVLDAYVPIYIEVSARNSEDKKTELINYQRDIVNFNHVLQRGDYLLCANDPQKHMYAGILGSLGIINPVTYHDERIIVVPFGIESKPLPKLSPNNNPYNELGVSKDDFVLLWFGGLYPWFDFSPLLAAIDNLSSEKNFKFVLVGGKNPYNSHPDFVKQYDKVKSHFEKSNLLGSTVHMIDWVDFNERIYWYLGADAVISLNQPGEENIYSWRTRVMDYVWGALPMLTNGGDPLSDYLLSEGAALKLSTSEEEVLSGIKQLLEDKPTLSRVKENLLVTREKFHWEKVVSPIVSHISNDPSPFLEFKNQRKEWGIAPVSVSGATTPQPQGSKVQKLYGYYDKAREKGIKRSARFALSVGKNYTKAKVRSLRKSSSESKVILLSHPIDETGAPLVLMDIAKDFASHIGGKKIHVVTPSVKKYLLKELVKRKIKVDKMAEGIRGRIIHAQLDVHYNDFVLLNTVAVYENYRTYVYWLLENNKLKEADWFIHEDNPKLRFTNKTEADRIRKLIAQKKIKVFVPSAQTAKDYNEFFKTDMVRPVTLRVSIPTALTKPRTNNDFSSISFVTSGSPWDGRKGQFLLLNALLYFESKLRDPAKEYRPYDVHLLALGDDYISQQLISTGNAFFGKGFHSYEKVPREKALEITSRCNVTVCSSLNETFALFVAEGMAMGHPIVRNKSAGWEEQIEDGKNGYLFDNLSLESLAGAIEKILDVQENSNNDLVKMSAASQKIATTFDQSDYYSQLTV
jgi:glycosyltransferase involved in cell wall biosynthesis